MNLRRHSTYSTRTTRWEVALAAAVAGLATCLPAVQGSPDAVEGAAQPLVRAAHTTSSFNSDEWGDAKADAVSKDVSGRNTSDKDPGSLFMVGKAIGARAVWAKKDDAGRQLTGQGVGVALLDSGVARVAGLTGAGKVTYGPDLSIEANGPLTQRDGFGHGTFMAGIIAARGTTDPSSSLSEAPASTQLGVAPDAALLAIKLANRDGSTDVSEVIAALDWVTQHPVLPDGTRVRVINLSYGTSSTQDYLADPLAAAAENAWRHGIVVVTSAGNDGSDDGRLNDPAIDPHVIAVGATDNHNTLYGWGADKATVASFSQVGSASRHVDLVAPGTSMVSTRAPGSFIDVHHPAGRPAGDVTGTLFRGSGTSEAAAVVSGSVALLLQAYPSLTPDQVKYALTSSADPVKDASEITSGAGALDLRQALETAGRLSGTDARARTLRAAAVQDYPASTGQGSIDAARGGSVLVDVDGVDLSGEIDVQGNPWDAAAWWAATSSTSAWSGGQWMGSTWTGDDWQADSHGLTSSRWSSSRWSSSRWSTADWDSSRWSSSRWSSSRWSSPRWSSSRWSSSDGS
ncbi:S8 family serine peptidase [Dermatophilaceae bacterium Soc4.6]